MIELINGDCMDYMRGLPDNAFELCIADPPYGIGMSNSNKRTKPSRPNSYTKYKDFRYKEANWDDERPSKECFEQIFRISKNQIIWGANYFCEFIPSGSGWIFWNKLNGLDNCFSDGEFAFSSKGVQSKYFACSVFDGLNGGKDRIHPTEKPIKLYEWVLLNYATKGDKIFDPFLGSGSSAIASDILDFDFVGIELDKDYFEAAKLRLENHQRQLKLF